MKVSSTLTMVLDLFTPSDQVSLDEGDVDFGAGGLLVLPDQPGPKHIWRWRQAKTETCIL